MFPSATAAGTIASQIAFATAKISTPKWDSKQTHRITTQRTNGETEDESSGSTIDDVREN